MKWIHITAGLLSLLAGFFALYSAKGGALHRKAGMAFVWAMLTMTTSAVLLAAFHHPNRVNVVAGTLTFTLVATGLLAVTRRVDQIRPLLAVFMFVSAGIGLYALALGFEARANPHGLVDQIPAPPVFMFGVIGLLAAIGDARMLWAGVLEGRRRLGRHLWRLGYAMWVATSSAFLGQAKFVPEPYRDFRMLALPVLLVAGTLVYWMVRVRWHRRPLGGTAPRAVKPITMTEGVSA
jgi:hypothetical protein